MDDWSWSWADIGVVLWRWRVVGLWSWSEVVLWRAKIRTYVRGSNLVNYGENLGVFFRLIIGKIWMNLDQRNSVDEFVVNPMRGT